MPILWLDDDSNAFPNPELSNEQGVLAVGGDLSVPRLLTAYSKGIFPWYNPDDPILWWCPDPRFVLYPDNLKVAKSMRPYFNQGKYAWTIDQDFEKVITFCQRNKRKGQHFESWITEDMRQAYIEMHQQGFAHSVEVWENGELIGGLYGVALGNIFFGESMFSLKTNASKFGFISLVQVLKAKGFAMIDCQQKTRYLADLGAASIPRVEFLANLDQHVKSLCPSPRWREWLPEQSGRQHLPTTFFGDK